VVDGDEPGEDFFVCEVGGQKKPNEAGTELPSSIPDVFSTPGDLIYITGSFNLVAEMHPLVFAKE
jgi:hypothetical protein